MSLRYVLREGVAGIRRARLAAVTSTFSLFIAVFLMGMLLRVGSNAWDVGQTLRQQVEVELFLEQDTEEERRQIEALLGDSGLVQEVHYISKDSAATIFREEFGYGGESLAALDFLPASFRVTLEPEAEIQVVQEWVDQVTRWDGVEEVVFNRALLQMLESRIETLGLAGGALALLITLAAIILVFNTIRLTIYAKRDLIRAMKLVGATHALIRRPFLIEGMLQGLVGAAFACLAVYAIFAWAIPEWIPQLGELGWPGGRWYYQVGAMMLAGVIAGWWGSRWASRKFIRDARVYH
ncbi:MAG: permease-like cell division protein FtsX [Balneolaceae bacterium]